MSCRPEENNRPRKMETRISDEENEENLRMSDDEMGSHI